jgi:DNA-binding IclR family transcriptional regulator
MADEQTGAAPQSQTLDRGIRILEHLASVGRPLPIAEIGSAVGLHRSIAYRLLRTLEDHQLVDRVSAGQYTAGLGLVTLARGVRGGLQAAAGPWLHGLVEELGMTAFLVVRSGADAVTVQSVEPQHTAAHVAYRPGSRHPVDRGAPGLALLMPDPPAPGDRTELRDARRTGWATSHGEVIAGLHSVAAPIVGPDGSARGAMAVVYLDEDAEVATIGQAVAIAAQKTAAALA